MRKTVENMAGNLIINKTPFLISFMSPELPITGPFCVDFCSDIYYTIHTNIVDKVHYVHTQLDSLVNGSIFLTPLYRGT